MLRDIQESWTTAVRQNPSYEIMEIVLRDDKRW